MITKEQPLTHLNEANKDCTVILLVTAETATIERHAQKIELRMKLRHTSEYAPFDAEKCNNFVPMRYVPDISQFFIVF